MDDLDADLVGYLDLHQGILERLDRTGRIALDDNIEHVDLGLGELLLEVLEGDDLATLGQLGGTLGGLTLLGNLASGTIIGGDQEEVTGGGHGGQAQHLNRCGRTGRFHRLTVLVEHGTHAAVRSAGHDGIAHVERTLLNQHSGHGTTTLVESGFDGGTTGVHVGVGAEVQLSVSREQHGFEQLVDVQVLLGGDVDEHGVATILFRDQAELGELAADLLRVGTGHIDLVDGHDDRHLGGLSVVDGLNGLGHHTIVGGDHEDRDVSELGTTGTHGGERLVARGIKEGDLARFAFKVHGDLVGTDALGNAAGLTCDDVGLADGIQQSCLTVVDVAHDGNDRRARLEILVILQFFLVKVDVELLEQFLVFLFCGDELDVPADLFAQNLEGLLIQGLGGGSHLTQVEEHGDQRGLVDVDLLRKIGQGRALTQTDGLAVAVGDANAADGRCFQLLILMALCQTVLTGL